MEWPMRDAQISMPQMGMPLRDGMNGHSAISKWLGAAPSNALAPGAMAQMAALEQHGKSLFAMATNGHNTIGKWPGAGPQNTPAPGAMA